MQILPSLFTCPICRKPLLRMENSYRCWSGHSYDLSAAGYIHLLPANKMHSKNPGDDKAMVAARTAFLDAGYYESLRRALCSIAADLCAGKENCTLFDSGCGEGYYTFGIHNTLRQNGVAVRTAGIDISTHALRKALLPIVTMIGMQIPMLFGGAVIIEQMFSWPGLGLVTMNAITGRDYPVIMGVCLLSAVVVLVANLLTDIIYALVDPTIKY